jgi:predicted P-loop ATPase
MTGVVEYRTLHGSDEEFRPVDVQMKNTMSIMALKAGIGSWDRDINRYVDSTLIGEYEPMKSYLDSLPKWDGRERVELLARRIKTANGYWPADFHRWMLAMVAMWLGIDRSHGNSVVPVLVGRQGSGKTTFCRLLLPDSLQLYYSDRLNMRNDTDINLALSGYALINIDEFDGMSRSLQPLLKYLLSKSDVKMRPPFGQVMVNRRRYASFIATTNCQRPLVDVTGSRRFICVCADQVNNTRPVNHAQLYAQLKHELLVDHCRHWFCGGESRRLQRMNQAFQRVSDYETMVTLSMFPPEKCVGEAMVPLAQVMAELEHRFSTFVVGTTTHYRLGRILSAMGYESQHSKHGILYQVKWRK